jgi:hypothetical protein
VKASVELKAKAPIRARPGAGPLDDKADSANQFTVLQCSIKDLPLMDLNQAT